MATFELLSAIRAAGPDASQIEIARRLGITAPTLTEAVRLAKDRGLLDQTQSDSDRRRRKLVLTAQGEKTIREVLHAVNRAERSMVEGIDPTALTVTIETLRQANLNLAKSLSKHDE